MRQVSLALHWDIIKQVRTRLLKWEKSVHHNLSASYLKSVRTVTALLLFVFISLLMCFVSGCYIEAKYCIFSDHTQDYFHLFIKLRVQSLLLGVFYSQKYGSLTWPCLLQVCKVTQSQKSSSALISIQAGRNGRFLSLSLFPDHIPRCFPHSVGR